MIIQPQFFQQLDLPLLAGEYKDLLFILCKPRKRALQPLVIIIGKGIIQYDRILLLLQDFAGSHPQGKVNLLYCSSTYLFHGNPLPFR